MLIKNTTHAAPRVCMCALLVLMVPPAAGMEKKIIITEQGGFETDYEDLPVLAGDPGPTTDPLEVKAGSSIIDYVPLGVVEQVQKFMQQTVAPGASLQELAWQTMEAFLQGPKIIIRSSDIPSLSDIPVDLRGIEYKGLLAEFVDFDKMGKLVLGEYQGQLSAAQFKEFVSLYKEFLLTRKVFGTVNTWDGAVEIAGLAPVGKNGFMVTFNVDSSELGKARLDFYIHKSDTGFPFKFADVIVEGISLVKTQRADFAAIIQTRGLEGLNQMLASRTQAGAAP